MLAITTQNSRYYRRECTETEWFNPKTLHLSRAIRRVPYPLWTISKWVGSSRARSKMSMSKLSNQDFRSVWVFGSFICEWYFSCLSNPTLFLFLFLACFLSVMFRIIWYWKFPISYHNFVASPCLHVDGRARPHVVTFQKIRQKPNRNLKAKKKKKTHKFQKENCILSKPKLSWHDPYYVGSLSNDRLGPLPLFHNIGQTGTILFVKSCCSLFLIRKFSCAYVLFFSFVKAKEKKKKKNRMMLNF